MLFRQIRKQHLAHQGRALRLADHQNSVDDQRAIDLLVDQLEMQLVGDRQTEQIGHGRAIERRQQRHGHERTELRGIGHVGEHLHHADQRADHAEGRRAIADGAIDLLPFVKMGEKVVAVALEVVANKRAVVAVGNEADALGEKRIVDFDLLQADRALLACNFGKTGKLIDQIALAHPPHREGELHPERQAVEDRSKRKADQRCGEGAAENDDEGMGVEEHRNVAAHEDEREQNDDTGH